MPAFTGTYAERMAAWTLARQQCWISVYTACINRGNNEFATKTADVAVIDFESAWPRPQ